MSGGYDATERMLRLGLGPPGASGGGGAAGGGGGGGGIGAHMNKQSGRDRAKEIASNLNFDERSTRSNSQSNKGGGGRGGGGGSSAGSVHGGRQYLAKHGLEMSSAQFDDSFSNDPLGDFSILGGFSDNQTSVHSRSVQLKNLAKDTRVLNQEQLVYREIPPAYVYNPKTAEPQLYFVPKAIQQQQTIQMGKSMKAKKQQEAQAKAQKGKKGKQAQQSNQFDPSQSSMGPPLKVLLQAADDDIRLHRARVKASLDADPRLLRQYRFEHDPMIQERNSRLGERMQYVASLKDESLDILNDLKETDAVTSGLTVKERQQVQLARWQRALELYVYCHKDTHYMDHLGVLDKLLDGISEEEEMSEVLSEAANMCSILVDATGQILKDAAENVTDVEDAYKIRLEAHELFARTALSRSEEIQNQFRINGRAALQIGHQLEFAESKRKQCESASRLIRRWWLLENLAEQEELSNDPIRVEDEIRGLIPETACRMDPLFIRPEQSLEAAKTLKQLRAVVRSRGTNATTAASSAGTAAATPAATTKGGAGSGAQNTPIITETVTGIDKNAARRFELTANLITRTSDALEQRLLHNFSGIYTSGGVYDFSPKPRPGSIDWRELQALSQALLTFDSGRNLHQRYVDMVLSTRFPDLFKNDGTKRTNWISDMHGEDESEGENTGEFDMDATCSKLSTLFHRVSDVCTAEFELIAHVFGSPSTNDPKDNPAGGAGTGANGTRSGSHQRTDLLEGNEAMPLVVARALLQRVISDPNNGLQCRINDLLESIDRTGDFDAGAKKLDTFVVIHEKAAGLFALLKDASSCMIPEEEGVNMAAVVNAKKAVESLKSFLTSQELALSNTHRQSYINLELRLLHHDCCSCLDNAGCTLVKPPPPPINRVLAEKGILEDYVAPVLPLHKPSLLTSGLASILAGPLKPSVLRQPLIHATDSLARARLMFGSGGGSNNSGTGSNTAGGVGVGVGVTVGVDDDANAGTNGNDSDTHQKKKDSSSSGETMARVITSIYKQMCKFYGEGYLYPVTEVLTKMLNNAKPPSQPPNLPFDEEEPAPNLGVEATFWVALERVHSAAKSFDRELWAESRDSSGRVWDILEKCCKEANVVIPTTTPQMIAAAAAANNNNTPGGANNNTAAAAAALTQKDGEKNNSSTSLEEIIHVARQTRYTFYSGLEQRGEAAMLMALDTISNHIQWILVTGGESMLATGTTSVLHQLTGQSGGPYAIPAGSSLETPNSPAVKSLTFCLRVQFVNIQNALTPQSRSRFWTALSMRLYDILVPRLLQHYLISTVGAVILFRDVDALRSVAMLAGTNHQHWDTLRELLSLYMTPSEGIKNMLLGTSDNPADAGSGLFAKVGKEQCLVFLSRRFDYRYKTAGVLRKSGWVTELYKELNMTDPSDGKINLGLFAAGRNK